MQVHMSDHRSKEHTEKDPMDDDIQDDTYPPVPMPEVVNLYGGETHPELMDLKVTQNGVVIT